MKNFWGRVGYLYFALVTIFCFVVLFPLQYLLLQRKSWYNTAQIYRRFCTRVLLFGWGIKYEIINPQFLDLNGPLIICSNHSSLLDPLLILAIYRHKVCTMSDAGVSNIPVFSIYFKTIDIEVNRKNSSSGAVAYRKAVRAIENGQKLIIFPEGGIRPDPLKVKSFKDGAFQIAIKHKIPILPIGLPDCYKLMPDVPKIAKPGKIRIILHEPLQTSDLKITDIDALKEKLRSIIQKDILS